MFDYRLSLAAGTDIPIVECQLTAHQPSITEIALIGETSFFTGVQILCLNKSMYVQDKEAENQITNFEVFITMVNEKSMSEKKQDVLSVLQLLFPDYKVIFTPRAMVFNKDNENFIIDESNFEYLQKVLRQMFCLNKTDQDTFNPSSKKAKEIADKLMRARKKLAEENSTGNDSSMFGQYLSIITVGVNSMSYTDCLKLTMYQMYDLIERYLLYVNWDIDVRSRLAGASGDKPVDNWMKQIH